MSDARASDSRSRSSLLFDLNVLSLYEVWLKTSSRVSKSAAPQIRVCVLAVGVRVAFVCASMANVDRESRDS